MDKGVSFGMFSKSQLLLLTPPTQSRAAAEFGLSLGHVCYRIGSGGHLFRAQLPVAPRGGLLVVDDDGFDGRGEATPFCHELLRECAAREFRGVVCAFSPRPRPILKSVVAQLGELMEKRGLPLYVSESCAAFSEKTRVLIPSSLSGGSLLQRLREAVQRLGSERTVLLVRRLALDFFLPSPDGQGVPLSQEELRRRMVRLSPSVFFSDELCAHYFTYMSRQDGAHFILFDNAGSIRKKLLMAHNLGLAGAALEYQEVSDLLPDLLA